ncbi:hypothetical protein L1887_57821 [Cichorium endivia]|nr:hypothetical protein L1887_57821 [Cichorium endivia]
MHLCGGLVDLPGWRTLPLARTDAAPRSALASRGVRGGHGRSSSVCGRPCALWSELGSAVEVHPVEGIAEVVCERRGAYGGVGPRRGPERASRCWTGRTCSTRLRGLEQQSRPGGRLGSALPIVHVPGSWSWPGGWDETRGWEATGADADDTAGGDSAGTGSGMLGDDAVVGLLGLWWWRRNSTTANPTIPTLPPARVREADADEEEVVAVATSWSGAIVAAGAGSGVAKLRPSRCSRSRMRTPPRATRASLRWAWPWAAEAAAARGMCDRGVCAQRRR